MNNFKYISNLITDNQWNSTILYNLFHVALANWIKGIGIYIHTSRWCLLDLDLSSIKAKALTLKPTVGKVGRQFGNSICCLKSIYSYENYYDKNYPLLRGLPNFIITNWLLPCVFKSLYWLNLTCFCECSFIKYYWDYIQSKLQISFAFLDMRRLAP